ncbi:hypothetical protein SPRG_10540 [Saprolegnia parasitica CBS 223.65]|uniref:Uncharacterized protein n=1 Tax=Saprolegnia parasitica (strain CBS 223.65) TaxID=695850 RepID=A0A067BZS8_SAPPC|nr:hypothetical protein SPRG_10540 [Saprolegnia parasitica CBS 223.65]KDO23763.1 hypothetical protein SPRG_10540 [Saprolegnia parasitica CBS 223.65]|eukprot:XP_012205578.1 hypothetical protein SPRG_10540 [Saprolegnia parasitica CBS 223.65]
MWQLQLFEFWERRHASASWLSGYVSSKCSAWPEASQRSTDAIVAAHEQPILRERTRCKGVVTASANLWPLTARLTSTTWSLELLNPTVLTSLAIEYGGEGNLDVVSHALPRLVALQELIVDEADFKQVSSPLSSMMPPSMAL